MHAKAVRQQRAGCGKETARRLMCERRRVGGAEVGEKVRG